MPHEAVPEVSKSILYINQKKNDVPIEIVGDILNTSHFGQLHFARPFLLNCFLTELLVYWTVTCLSYYLIELWLHWQPLPTSQFRIWLNLFSGDSNKVGICLVCRSTQLDASTSSRSRWRWVSTWLWQVAVHNDMPVFLRNTTPVLLCTTKYYSSTSLYYKVLLQY